MDKCYKKERADRLTGKHAGASTSAQRPPSAYLTDGTKSEAKGIRYESAFMAIADDSSANLSQPILPSMAEAAELPSLVGIPGNGFSFSDPSNAIRYLGLCCGASMHIIRSLVLRGRFFAELYLCDKDPVAR